MQGFESAAYRELNYPDSIAVYTVGRSVDEERNTWFDEVLGAFEDEGAETEGYWIGMNCGDVSYDVEANVFEYGFEEEIDEDVKLLVAPKPSVYRFNGEADGRTPMDNYRSLAMKVNGNLDSLLIKGLSEDHAGSIPSADTITNNLGNCLTGGGANMISMKSQSTGEEALMVKSTKFPYDVPEAR